MINISTNINEMKKKSIYITLEQHLLNTSTLWDLTHYHQDMSQLTAYLMRHPDLIERRTPYQKPSKDIQQTVGTFLLLSEVVFSAA
jgi:hypothetical protein